MQPVSSHRNTLKIFVIFLQAPFPFLLALVCSRTWNYQQEVVWGFFLSFFLFFPFFFFFFPFLYARSLFFNDLFGTEPNFSGITSAILPGENTTYFSFLRDFRLQPCPSGLSYNHTTLSKRTGWVTALTRLTKHKT